jgi:hypothetical protein
VSRAPTGLPSGQWPSAAGHARLFAWTRSHTGLAGIAGTLLGSVISYLFQSRAATRTEAFARDERLRQEHLSACTAFAASLTELKRGLVTLWFYVQRGEEGADYQAARIECDRLGASAEAARFRVQLVSGDARLMDLADAAFTPSGPFMQLRTETRYASVRTALRLQSRNSSRLAQPKFVRSSHESSAERGRPATGYADAPTPSGGQAAAPGTFRASRRYAGAVSGHDELHRTAVHVLYAA